MAHRVELGLTLGDIQLEDYILPHGTPVVVDITGYCWIITVVQGEYQGVKFKMGPEEASEAISIAL
jgi:hypothetical protein